MILPFCLSLKDLADYINFSKDTLYILPRFVSFHFSIFIITFSRIWWSWKTNPVIHFVISLKAQRYDICIGKRNYTRAIIPGSIMDAILTFYSQVDKLHFSCCNLLKSWDLGACIEGLSANHSVVVTATNNEPCISPIDAITASISIFYRELSGGVFVAVKRKGSWSLKLISTRMFC